MNITFLIGNGFDLNLGLKTRYTDFYDYYQSHASKDSVILQLMRDDNYKENWADLEWTLGQKLNEISEEDVNSFMDAHAELDFLLLEYLEKEQKKYNVEKLKEEIVAELARSLKELSKELNPEEQQSYQTTCNNHKNEELQYSFITFNYTSILDEFMKSAKSVNLDLGVHKASNGQDRKHTLGEVHHVHGSLMESVVLGVNDETQINNENLKKNSMLKSVFVKSSINRQMGQRRTENAEKMITNSQIVCIFGMSLGVTDKRWWEKLIKWLIDDSSRKLIIYTREDEALLNRRIPTQIIRERERVRRDFWDKGRGNNAADVYSSISSRLFVVFNSKIFNFPKCSE